MKTIFITDLLLQDSTDEEVRLSCWLSYRKCLGGIIFLTLVDSTGHIQGIVEKNGSKEAFDAIKKIPLESSIEVMGSIRSSKNNQNELCVKSISVIGITTLQLYPHPRSSFDILNEKNANNILRYRHIYIRHPKMIQLLMLRSKVMAIIRRWFEKQEFIEIDTPIIVPAPLYDDSTAIKIKLHGEDLFLTQCAGFYLEAAVHAFEKVYNMGPSFRAEESRSKRHLKEYWHVKAEIAWADFEDIISIVETLMKFLTETLGTECKELISKIDTGFCTHSLQIPFPRISYEDAIKTLQSKGSTIVFGESLSTEEEIELSKGFSTPFWVTGIPRLIEPFPYVIHQTDKRIAVVADLIASNGCGELVGVAEKIYDYGMLMERMQEKGKADDQRYRLVKDVHSVGCVPHAAFGMGLERLIRWLFNIEHVRDTIAFPRIVRRKIYP
jgi:asparaginyl-tRNA synthetase